MSVWRRSRTEVAGAWRSLRYDLGRRPSEPPADGHDVTSTGMNTFGGTSWDRSYFDPEPIEMPVAGRMPPPQRASTRRAAAVSVFGLLLVIGAAAAYLVAVNGLVPLRDEGPAAAGTLPPAPRSTTAEARIGHPPAVPKAKPRTVIETTRPETGKPAEVAAKPPEKASPIRTTDPANPICCTNPPVPTPTAPSSSPSATASATTSPSASVSESLDPSDKPSEWPEPRKGRISVHHRRHR
jgi:hypothetical protein